MMTMMIGKYGMTLLEAIGWGIGIFGICSLLAFGMVRLIDALLDRIERED
tara:strand:+ start:215 stop:364 length:150 start_codon:yes stop_codon:yes gene_type:complete